MTRHGQTKPGVGTGWTPTKRPRRALLIRRPARGWTTVYRARRIDFFIDYFGDPGSRTCAERA